MSYRRIDAGDAFWRRSNQMGVLNTTDDALWLIAGAPAEPANTLEMSEEMRNLYPDGPKALPPELDRE